MSYTLIATMKNEAPFILEWVAHYKALGFDNIIVCFNNCSDGTAKMLRRLQQMGLVRPHSTRIRTGGIQRSAMRQANTYPEAQDAEWTFICDADEFLNIHIGNHSVQDLVHLSGDTPDIISIPWRIFGNAGVEHIEDAPVTRQFTLAEAPYHPETAPNTGKFVKSLYSNAHKFKRTGLHFPIPHAQHEGDLKWVLPGGAPYSEGGERTANPPLYAAAQVNHYALRSVDSYLVKRDRGRANHTKHVLGLDYWEKFNLNDMEDHTIRRYDAQVEPILHELRADPRLAELQAQALAWHRDRAARMAARDGMEAMIAQMRQQARATRAAA